jgi:hypothetical protein
MSYMRVFRPRVIWLAIVTDWSLWLVYETGASVILRHTEPSIVSDLLLLLLLVVELQTTLACYT